MAKTVKLDKNQLPSGHSFSDFSCFGPPATKDGDFSASYMADLGCFNEEGKSSNKFYFGCVVQSKKDSSWYAYFQYGKTGANTVGYQFVPASSKDDAQSEYIKQIRSKNDKRGEWYNHPQLGKVLRAKKGKDCYLVRSLESRSVNITDANNISSSTAKVVSTSKVASASAKIFDREAESLIKDLSISAQQFTRSSIVGNTIPTLDAIEEARKIITVAVNEINGGAKEKDLEELTNILYSKIPKKKNPGQEYLLNPERISLWNDDLDAFENAVKTSSTTDNTYISTLDFHLETIDRNSEIGKFIYNWAPACTLNRHHNVGTMKIANIWKIDRPNKIYESACGVKKSDNYFPKNQPKSRPDLDKQAYDAYNKAGVWMLFHGTRSVNVGGILKETLKLPAQLRNTGVSTNGAAFGPGLYFASDWRKSHGYVSASNSIYTRSGGGISRRKCFMFIADVISGNCYVPNRSGNWSSYIDNKTYHSVYAIGGESGVQNDEIIIFKREHNTLKYLIEYEA